MLHTADNKKTNRSVLTLKKRESQRERGAFLWVRLYYILTPLPLRHIPDSDTLVLGIAEDQLLARVEDSTRHIVIMAPAGINLPCL